MYIFKKSERLKKLGSETLGSSTVGAKGPQPRRYYT
jgi:hypothetical protein